MSSIIDVSSRDFTSQIEKLKAMQLISDTADHNFIPDSDSDDSDDFTMFCLDSKEFMRLEGMDIAMMSPLFDSEGFYSYALLPLAYFNAQHNTYFEFHKLVKAYARNPYAMYIKFEAISPAIGGGLPLVFQSQIDFSVGRPIRVVVDFCRLHPIDCSYTLDDLPVFSSTDHTKSRVIAAAAFSTDKVFTFMPQIPEKGGRLTLKEIVSFEEIIEPILLGGFDLKYRITFNVFKTKVVSYVSGPIETVVAFGKDLKEMELVSIVEKKMSNETLKDDSIIERVRAML